jgi:hypothetical protein
VGAITAHANIGLSPDFVAGPRVNLFDKPSGFWNRMKLAVWVG